MLTPVVVPADSKTPAASADGAGGPLLGPSPAVTKRTYVAFGTSTRGRKGPLSKRVTVPLVPPPPPPGVVTVTYDEKAFALAWPRAGGSPPTETGDSEGVLPSTTIGPPRVAITYNVYDATNADAPIKLTTTPLETPGYSDPRIVFGERRCYTVVAAETIAGATIESEATSPVCKTPVDTFPPAIPKELKAIPSEGAISLIWEPNTEKDIAGYIVLRGVEPAETLQPITPTPIVEASFRDGVMPGVAYVYAVIAVDRAGNQSAPSARVIETAR
jgi:hypothetical protein